MMIAVGEWLFGLTPFGWRFSVALVGSLAILMLARIVRRMTGSTLLGCVAGLLLALDGLELVLSRTAILDIFVMFWVLAAFGLLVIDRDRTRARLAAAAGTDGEPGSGDPTRAGPELGIRWLRVAAGRVPGRGRGVQVERRLVPPRVRRPGRGLGPGRPARGRVPGPAGRACCAATPSGCRSGSALVPAVVYIAVVVGLVRHPLRLRPDRDPRSAPAATTPSTIVAWLQYNKWMLQFGLGLTTGQTYKSNPLGWLLLARPISFYSNCLPAKGCGGPGSTEQEVLAIGTPAIWWAAIAATLFCLVWWLMRRDWRAGAALLGISAGWLPWIWFYLHDERTEFYYYAVTFEPFLIIAITLVPGADHRPGRGRARPPGLGAVVAGAYLIAVLANFAYLYPDPGRRVIPYTAWLSRMWFRSWI